MLVARPYGDVERFELAARALACRLLRGAMTEHPPETPGHYGRYYGNFANSAYSEIRTAEFGEDLGQNNWQTHDELEHFAAQLELARGVRLLDVACGTGGLSVHLAQVTGCDVTGIDLEESGLDNGRRIAREAGLEARARFARVDAGRRLPFAGGSFDAVVCIDALNHSRVARRCSPTGRACSSRAAGCSSPTP